MLGLFHNLRRLGCVLYSLFFLIFVSGTAMAAPAVTVLCYHSVDPGGDIYNVTPERLREHFQYFKDQGYTVISPKQVQAAARGAKLPAKPLMLSFDDGYGSFYTAAYPQLKEFHYSATMFIISSWPDTAATKLTWQQIQAMDRSGLVTIGSHTQDMHHFAPVNSYGDQGPVTETPPYVNGYMTENDYFQLMQQDLLRSRQTLEAKLGHPVRILASGSAMVPWAGRLSSSQPTRQITPVGTGGPRRSIRLRDAC